MPFEKEITWLRVDKGTIFQIKRDLLRESYTTTVSLPLGLEFAVETNQKDQLSHIERLFRTDNSKICNKSVAQIAGPEKSEFVKYGLDIRGIKSPYVGLLDSSSSFSLLLGEEDGLLKSLIVGFASNLAKEQGYHPIHASICQVNKLGIALAGGHLTGKTTSLFSLLYVAGKDVPKKILTDDWALVQGRSGDAISLEDAISFTDRFGEEFKFLGLEHFFHNIPKPSGKIYISPDKVYGIGTKIEKSGIDVVVLLEPLNRTSLIKPVNLDYAAEKIVEDAYHMPICSEDQAQVHKNFWKQFLNSRRIFSFDTRNSMGVPESYKILYEYIFGGRK